MKGYIYTLDFDTPLKPKGMIDREQFIYTSIHAYLNLYVTVNESDIR